MLKTFGIIPLIFILFLFGFTLISVAPVMAAQSPEQVSTSPLQEQARTPLSRGFTTREYERLIFKMEKACRSWTSKDVCFQGQPALPSGATAQDYERLIVKMEEACRSWTGKDICFE
jgi:hypothetical protein|tara:strand:+ start:47 stop:397 length:351 start_codon:yes stop_codon:yes gene_type:complete